MRHLAQNARNLVFLGEISYNERKYFGMSVSHPRAAFTAVP